MASAAIKSAQSTRHARSAALEGRTTHQPTAAAAVGAAETNDDDDDEDEDGFEDEGADEADCARATDNSAPGAVISSGSFCVTNRRILTARKLRATASCASSSAISSSSALRVSVALAAEGRGMEGNEGETGEG